MWDNASAETLKHAPGRIKMLAGYLTPLVAIAVVAVLFPDSPVTDALRAFVAVMLVTIAGAVLFFGFNLFVAPMRLDREMRGRLKQDHDDAAAAIAELNAERDQARADLARYQEATAVTVTVSVVAVGALRTIDTSPGAIDELFAEERRALGGPEPTDGQSAVDIVEQAYRHLGVAAVVGEDRTRQQFDEEVHAWLTAAGPNGELELLLMGLTAHAAQLRIRAQNTGLRQLSDVRVTLQLPAGIGAWWAGDKLPNSMLPKRPRKWDVSRFSERSALVATLREPDIFQQNLQREIERGEHGLRIVLEPEVLPAGDLRALGSFLLTLPPTMAGEVLRVRWRATAQEALGDATGVVELPIEPGPLSFPELRALADARAKAK